MSFYKHGITGTGDYKKAKNCEDNHLCVSMVHGPALQIARGHRHSADAIGLWPCALGSTTAQDGRLSMPSIREQVSLRTRSTWTWHHAIIDAVRTVGRLEPRITAQVVGYAPDVGLGAPGRHRRIDRSHRIRSINAAGRIARVVGVRRGCIVIRIGHCRPNGRAGNRTDRQAGGGSSRGAPSPAIGATAAVVVHGRRWMIGAIAATVIGAGTIVSS